MISSYFTLRLNFAHTPVLTTEQGVFTLIIGKILEETHQGLPIQLFSARIGIVLKKLVVMTEDALILLTVSNAMVDFSLIQVGKNLTFILKYLGLNLAHTMHVKEMGTFAQISIARMTRRKRLRRRSQLAPSTGFLYGPANRTSIHKLPRANYNQSLVGHTSNPIGLENSQKNSAGSKREPHTFNSYSSLQDQKMQPLTVSCFIDQQGSSQSLGEVSTKIGSKKQSKKTAAIKAPFVIKEDLANEIDSPLGKFDPRRVYEDLLDDELSQSLDRSEDYSRDKLYQNISDYDFSNNQQINIDQIVDSYLQQFEYTGLSYPSQRDQDRSSGYNMDHYQADPCNTPGNVNFAFGQEHISKANSKSHLNPHKEDEGHSSEH